MISKTLQAAFNDQIQKELFSAYLYLSMAAHFEAQSLPGFANWMKKQFAEEQAHAMKLWEHVYDRDGSVELKALPQPKTAFGDPLEVFEEVLAHEKSVTASINALYEVAVKEGDRAAQLWLDWFVTEQVEEEKNASDIIEMLKLTGGKGQALFIMDQQVLGKR